MPQTVGQATGTAIWPAPGGASDASSYFTIGQNPGTMSIPDNVFQPIGDYNEHDEIVGSDFDIDFTTGIVTVLTDGVYVFLAQVLFFSTALPAGSLATLDINLSFARPNVPTQYTRSEVPNMNNPADMITVQSVPYFFEAGDTAQALVAVDFPSGGPYTPDACILVGQRVA